MQQAGVSKVYCFSYVSTDTLTTVVHNMTYMYMYMYMYIVDVERVHVYFLSYIVFSYCQIDLAQSEKELRFLFSEENSDKGESDGLVAETGYRKPLCNLTLKDVPQLKQTLRDHMLVKVKAELDQFSEGLTTLGVLDKVKKYPSLMAPLFIDCGRKKLDKSEVDIVHQGAI